MVKSHEPSVFLNCDLIKTRLTELGLSYAAAAEKSENFSSDHAFSKATMHRMATRPDRKFPTPVVQTLARLLNVPMRRLIISEDHPSGFDAMAKNASSLAPMPNEFVYEKRKILELIPIKSSSQFQEINYGIDCRRLKMNAVPVQDIAQEGLMKILQEIDTPTQTSSLVEIAKVQIAIEESMFALASDGVGIYYTKTKEVAPFTVHPTSFNVDIEFSLAAPEAYRKHSELFDGVGICDVLVLVIDRADSKNLTFEHDFDPGLLVGPSRDPFLHEGLTRLMAGAPMIYPEDIKTMSNADFFSKVARHIELQIDRPMREEREAEAMVDAAHLGMEF